MRTSSGIIQLSVLESTPPKELIFVFVLLTRTFFVVNKTGANVRASWLP